MSKMLGGRTLHEKKYNSEKGSSEKGRGKEVRQEGALGIINGKRLSGVCSRCPKRPQFLIQEIVKRT